MSQEIWKPVAGFEGYYEVSCLGRIKSLARLIARTSRLGNVHHRVQAERILALGPHTSGYRCAHLYKEGDRRATLLHIVVAEAFLGPKPSPDMEVRHLDGDKDNCAAANLAWGTHQENVDDQVGHGTRRVGEKHVGAKLTVESVRAIRQRAGEPQQELADEFGCTFSNISAIQLRKSWRHV